MGRRLTPEKRAELIPRAKALHARGESQREISRQLGVSQETVRRWLVELVDVEVTQVEQRTTELIREVAAGRHLNQRAGELLEELEGAVKDLRALGQAEDTPHEVRVVALTSAGELVLEAIDLLADRYGAERSK